MFRNPIRRLLDRVSLTKIDAWGLKAEFEKGLDKIDILTPPKVEEATHPPRLTIAMDQQIAKDVPTLTQPESGVRTTLTPEIFVLEAWRELEGSMRRLIDAKHPRAESAQVASYPAAAK
jgi:hypothetical protein